ncbi:MAG: Arginine-tRNA ligase [Candidatus Nomurabacteria bacterium GW2011_GWA1_46_11]|uniref:Arginine--tRNA ligase n=1 Tax=Candidatus Nomurabacteria bacterium GW2011_GWA1_46_11 TaxID=1618732 RepID=A0A0G1RMZ6_9BACT|nr:MAG: Arginine-tRNA ligase [Candidatus Nomurabacteria bacterium GW2011_GWA1_46_11]
MIQTIREAIAKRLGDSEFEVKIENSLERGHFSTNAAFILSEKEKLRPKEAAEELRSFLRKHDEAKVFDRIELGGGGFINIWLSQEAIRGEFRRIVKAGGSWGKVKVKVKNRETVIVEYSSPGIAKPMHVGHIRSTIIGDAIANVYEFLGYRVVRWNYIGDWGTQFGKLIAAYKLWGNRREVTKDPVEELEKLYVRFHKELKNNPALEAEGREEFKKLEAGDKKNKKLWRWFKKESLKEFNRIYNRLGVTFSVSIGEAFYEKDLEGAINLLKEEGLAQESEGALMVELERFDLPPAMIRKSDGATLYLTRDIANLKYRIEEYEPKKILYVVANEQTLHFSQLFAIAKMIDLAKDKHMPELAHVKFGLVRGETGKKLSTREGTAIKLNELLDRSIKLSQEALGARKVELRKSEAKEVAEILGIGAVKYNDLSQNRMSDIVFDWEKMLSFEGNSAPYLQYTYARLKSILKKARGIPKLNGMALENERDLVLVLKLSEFPEVLGRVKETYMPSQLASYLYELAREVNSYYHSEPVLYSESELRAVRLNLVKAASDVIKTGLSLLGIKTVEKM